MDSYVSLNVGGVIYTTSLATLTGTDSMLKEMFSGNYDNYKDSQGHVVIDRDGTNFRYILNFLRDGTLILPEDFKEVELLFQEANFYQISLQSPSFVTVNMLGQEFKVTAKILKKFPEDLFKVGKRKGSTIYINRDGSLFQYILQYLSSGNLDLPNNFTEHEQLKADARFFKLHELIDYMSQPKTELVEVNLCGHTRFISTEAIKKKFPYSHLTKLLSYSPQKPEKTAVVINKNVKNFDKVINFIESWELRLNSEFTEWDALLDDVRTYQIPDMVDVICLKRNPSSRIPHVGMGLGIRCIGRNFFQSKDSFSLYPNLDIKHIYRNYHDEFTPIILNFVRGCGFIFPEEFTEFEAILNYIQKIKFTECYSALIRFRKE